MRSPDLHGDGQKERRMALNGAPTSDSKETIVELLLSGRTDEPSRRFVSGMAGAGTDDGVLWVLKIAAVVAMIVGTVLLLLQVS